METYCLNGKVIYDNITDANKSAKNTKHTKRVLKSYTCNICGKYHLATKNKRKRMKNIFR